MLFVLINKQTNKKGWIPKLLKALMVQDETDIFYVNANMEGITEKHKLMI